MTTKSHNWSLPDQICMPRGLATVRGRVFILYHPVAPGLPRAISEAQAYTKLRQHFESMFVLIWLGRPFPPPSVEVRNVFATAFAAGPRVEAVAWIVDSDRSLGASIVHSVSAQMFGPTPPLQLFRDPFEAASWLAGREGSDANLILDGLDALNRSQPA